MAKRRRGVSPLDQMMEQQRDHIHRAWAARHPARAAEERRLRQEHRAARRVFGKTPDGTAETHAKAALTRQGALARAYEAGHITLDELGWGCEIAQVHEHIGRDVAVRTMSMETRIDGGRSGDGHFFEALAAVRAEAAYTVWRASVVLPGLVMAIVYEDLGVSVAARRWRMRNTRARQLLCQGLQLWPRCIGEAVRDIDEATLLAAQAAIL